MHGLVHTYVQQNNPVARLFKSSVKILCKVIIGVVISPPSHRSCGRFSCTDVRWRWRSRCLRSMSTWFRVSSQRGSGSSMTTTCPELSEWVWGWGRGYLYRWGCYHWVNGRKISDMSLNLHNYMLVHFDLWRRSFTLSCCVLYCDCMKTCIGWPQ